METIDINEALPQISTLLERASLGGEILITKDDQPMVKLSAVDQKEETDRALNPDQKVRAWLEFVESLPKDTPNLPDEALHRDQMYD
jgi:antitoxin (DNA-binding transcriptional repressor) of toxin-antitoxin stability system